ncbi:MAG: Aldo/keto reductase, partial [uncultured Thermomicrobiales bacterium]
GIAQRTPPTGAGDDGLDGDAGLPGVRAAGRYAGHVRVLGAGGAGAGDGAGGVRRADQLHRHGGIVWRRRGRAADWHRHQGVGRRPRRGRAGDQGRPRPQDRRVHRRPDAALGRAQPAVVESRSAATRLPARSGARLVRGVERAGGGGRGVGAAEGRRGDRALGRRTGSDRRGDPLRRDRRVRGGDHPQPLHPRQPHRRAALARLRRARRGGGERRALRQRDAGEGAGCLPALRLSAGVARADRAGPAVGGDLRAAWRAAGGGGAPVLDPRSARWHHDRRDDQAGAARADRRTGDPPHPRRPLAGVGGGCGPGGRRSRDGSLEEV